MLETNWFKIKFWGTVWGSKLTEAERMRAKLARQELASFKNFYFFENFGDWSQFCEILVILISTSKFRKIVSRLLPHIGTNFGKFCFGNFGDIEKLQ